MMSTNQITLKSKFQKTFEMQLTNEIDLKFKKSFEMMDFEEEKAESLNEGNSDNTRVSVNLNEIEEYLWNNGSIKYIKNHINLVALPLLILSGIGIGFILVWAEDILVPFVISIFFTYLLRPLVDFLHKPFGKSSRTINMKPSCLPYSLKSTPAITEISTEHTNLLNQPNQSASFRKTSNDCYTDDNNGKEKTSSQSFKINCLNFEISSDDIGFPRVFSAILALLFAMSIVIGLIFFFIDAVQQFEQHNFKQYEDRAIEIAITFFAFLKRNFDIDGSKVFDELMKEIKVFEITTSLVYYLTDAIGYTFIVFLFMLYMLIEDTEISTVTQNDYIHVTQKEQDTVTQKHRYGLMRKQIDQQVQRYIVIKTLISAIVGFLIYLILGPLLNVKMANVFAVTTFLANFIPNVGAIVATLLPLPVLILDVDQSSLSILLAVMLPVGVHTIIGNFVEPKIFGDTMELHAVVVLLSLSLWFAVWGIPGAILAVPITAVIRIIVSNMSHPYAQTVLNLLEGKII